MDWTYEGEENCPGKNTPIFEEATLSEQKNARGWGQRSRSAACGAHLEDDKNKIAY